MICFFYWHTCSCCIYSLFYVLFYWRKDVLISRHCAFSFAMVCDICMRVNLVDIYIDAMNFSLFIEVTCDIFFFFLHKFTCWWDFFFCTLCSIQVNVRSLWWLPGIFLNSLFLVWFCQNLIGKVGLWQNRSFVPSLCTFTFCFSVCFLI